MPYSSPTTRDATWSISPLDGRYYNKIKDLSKYWSEAALIGARVRVEAHWILHLADLLPDLRRTLSSELRGFLAAAAQEAPEDCHAKVKAIEASTNHDVKAVEYYLRDELNARGAQSHLTCFLHFACTSEDINNLAYALLLNDYRREVLLPTVDKLITKLAHNAQTYRALPMLARTHGQSATPTTLGKEWAVFAHRVAKLRRSLADLAIEAKLNGAVGNFNAHYAAFPNLDWLKISRDLVETRLGLIWNPLTTQIENHDSLIAFTDTLKRLNLVLTGMARDIWSYIAIGYFKQTHTPGEVGSSTMPHKVNPIDFENAEGNLGLASAMAGHFCDKLLISRWQRDLSDSTVLRNLGSMFAYSQIAYSALLKGLAKLEPNSAKIAADLDQATEVLAEPVQTLMRKHGISDAYERLKAATRGQVFSRDDLSKLVDSCTQLPEETKAYLKALTPAKYLGIAANLVDQYLPRQ